jgi:hypothetical protein
MSSVRKQNKHYTPEEQQQLLNEPRWLYARDQVDKEILEKNFDFLNSAVVIRSDAQGIPQMTTNAVYGPIGVNDTVSLQIDLNQTVKYHSHEPVGDTSKHLLNQLKERKRHARAPEPEHCAKVQAKWVSGKDGGALPSVGKSANVFGATGSLYINEPFLDFPVVRIDHPKFDEISAYYGAKLLTPGEPFYMGYNKEIFGLEYVTSLPGYIQDYVMEEWGGGGLFVEHHPFPHIWFPNPSEGEERSNICRVLLGRIVPENGEQLKEQELDYLCNENECILIDGKKDNPTYRFTIFEIPTDGYALAVDECTIHNDSFCNGKQVVFIADTNANTVALRETKAFKNVRIHSDLPTVK